MFYFNKTRNFTDIRMRMLNGQANLLVTESRVDFFEGFV